MQLLVFFYSYATSLKDVFVLRKKQYIYNDASIPNTSPSSLCRLAPVCHFAFFGVVVYAFAAAATTKTSSGVTAWQQTEHDTN